DDLYLGDDLAVPLDQAADGRGQARCEPTGGEQGDTANGHGCSKRDGWRLDPPARGTAATTRLRAVQTLDRRRTRRPRRWPRGVRPRLGGPVRNLKGWPDGLHRCTGPVRLDDLPPLRAQ